MPPIWAAVRLPTLVAVKLTTAAAESWPICPAVRLPTTAFSASADMLFNAAEATPPTCAALNLPSWVAPNASSWAPVMEASCFEVTAARCAASRPDRAVPPSEARLAADSPPIWPPLKPATLAEVSLLAVAAESWPS